MDAASEIMKNGGFSLYNGFWAYMFGNYIPCPTKDLVQTYLMKDGSYYSAQSDYQTKMFVEEFNNRDPRIYQTLAYPGWELINTMTYAPGAGIYVQNLLLRALDLMI